MDEVWATYIPIVVARAVVASAKGIVRDVRSRFFEKPTLILLVLMLITYKNMRTLTVMYVRLTNFGGVTGAALRFPTPAESKR